MEKELEPHVILDEEEKEEEQPVVEEEKPQEEEVPVNEEQPVIEEAKSALAEAIKVLASSPSEDFENLDDESKKLLKEFALKQFNEELLARFAWMKNALLSLNNTLQKNLDDNEEFRVTSKQTLQKNVQILEDQVKGNQFNKILKPLANLYSTYFFMLDAPIDENKTRSNIEGILEEIEIILQDYNVEKIESKVGDDFNPVEFKIAKRVETNDESLDKKVALVRQPGWKKDRLVLVPLRADIYEFKAGE